MLPTPLYYKTGACKSFLNNFSAKSKKILGLGLVKPDPYTGLLSKGTRWIVNTMTHFKTAESSDPINCCPERILI